MRYNEAMITAIGFDWGGVLYSEPGGPLYLKLVDLLDVSPDDYNAAYFRYNKQANSGQITWRELWESVLRDLDRLDFFEQVLALSIESMDKVLDVQMLALVDKLRTNGYKVGLLTNNTIEKATELRAEGLETHFDAFIVSEEVGLAKPDPAIYLQFVDKLGVNIDGLLFIDDSPQSLSSADECGYTPVLFKDYQQLIQTLEMHGVNIS